MLTLDDHRVMHSMLRKGVGNRGVSEHCDGALVCDAGSKFSVPRQVNGGTAEYSACLCHAYALVFNVCLRYIRNRMRIEYLPSFLDNTWQY